MVSASGSKAKKIVRFLALVALFARAGGVSGGHAGGKPIPLPREIIGLRARLLQTNPSAISKATMQKVEQFNRRFAGMKPRLPDRGFLVRKRKIAHRAGIGGGTPLVTGSGVAAAGTLRRRKETRSVRRPRK